MRLSSVVVRCFLALWLVALPAAPPIAQTLDEATQLYEKAVELLDRDRFTEALPLAQKAWAIRDQRLGSKHPDTAKALNAVATTQYYIGNYAEAEPLFLRALATSENINGRSHRDTISILNNLGMLYNATGEYTKAESLQLRVVAVCEKTLGPEHSRTGIALGNLAMLYAKIGKHDLAKSVGQRALTISEKADGPEHPNVAAFSDSLALIYMRLGEYAGAQPLFERAVQIREKQFGRDHPTTAMALDHLAVLYTYTGELDKAEALLPRVIDIHERKLGAGAEFTGLALEHLGVVYLNMGKPAKAKPLLERAIRINQQRLGANHPDTATSLSNLASIHLSVANYAEAEELNQRALKIRQKVFGGEHPEVATSLNNLAMVSTLTGAYPNAKSLYHRALSMRERLLGNSHPSLAMSLDQMAHLYRTTGESDTALTLLLRALGIREAALGPKHPDTLTTVAALGSLYRDTGAEQRSESLLQRALDGQRRMLSTDHPSLIATQRELAKLYYATGRTIQGVKLQARACNYQRKAVGSEHPELVACLNDLALMHWGMRATPLATPTFVDAQAAQARASLRLLLSGSESRKRAYLQTVATDLASHVSFSVGVQNPAAAELGATDVLQFKGLLQDAMSNSLVRVRQDISPQDRELLDELAVVANQFSNLIYQRQDEASLKTYRKRAAELDRKQQHLETDLAKRTRLSRQITPVKLADVRALVPDDALLIEWLRYQPRDASTTIFDPKREEKPARYVAYLISQRDRPVVVVDVGDAQSIDALVAEFRRTLNDPQRGDYREKAAALARRVYTPLQPYARQYRQLLISADGALNLLPMGALVDEQGKHLIERFEISYLSSGRDLLAMASESHTASESLVVAGPSYGEVGRTTPLIKDSTPALRSVDLDRSGLRFRPLPGAMREGREIAKLLGLNSRNVLLQGDATEAALKRLRSPHILHIATHGFFLSDQTSLQRDRSTVATLPENPLLRSGLAFAGANLRRSGGRDDGILTALELAQLDLRGTQLVVLSACESGVGDVQNGDGVNGLRRAISLAGAQSQLTSLWKVADQPTQQLMIDYYQRLLRGVGRSAALREAQLAIKASSGYAHPYYWAAFVPIGDWRPLHMAAKRTGQASAKPRTSPAPRTQ